jgi:hypothetical protein
MLITQPSRINNPEIVAKGIELAKLDPISAKAIRNTLSSEEQSQLLKNDQVRDLIRDNPERQQTKLDQKEKKENIERIKSMASIKRAIE